MRRIQRASDKEDVIKRLTVGDKPYFKEIWKLLLFAAMLGYRSGRREKVIEADVGSQIRPEVFGNSPAWPGLLYLLSLVETDSHSILQSGEDQDNLKVTIFEEYANGGLAVLKERLDAAGYTIDGLLDLILSESVEPAAAVSIAGVSI